MMFSAFLLSMKAGSSSDAKGEIETDFFHGVIPNLFAALISGLAAAFTQKYTQGKGRAAYLFTMELCVWQTLFMFVITPVATFFVNNVFLSAAAASKAAADAGNSGFF